MFTGGRSRKEARNPKRTLKLGCGMGRGGLVFTGKGRSPSLSACPQASLCLFQGEEVGLGLLVQRLGWTRGSMPACNRLMLISRGLGWVWQCQPLVGVLFTGQRNSIDCPLVLPTLVMSGLGGWQGAPFFLLQLSFTLTKSEGHLHAVGVWALNSGTSFH